MWPDAPATSVADNISSGPAGGAVTLNQFVRCGSVSYDSRRFVAKCSVFNALNKRIAKAIGTLAFEVPGSHLMGFDAFGSTAWAVVAGVGLEHAQIVEVQLDTK
jgi:hypothetical protein